METAVLTTPNISRGSRLIGTLAKPKSLRELDAHFISLTKQIEMGLKPSLKFEEVEDALASGRVSPNVIDDLEDAMFGVFMQESRDDDNESVSLEEIMNVLRDR